MSPSRPRSSHSTRSRAVFLATALIAALAWPGTATSEVDPHKLTSGSHPHPDLSGIWDFRTLTPLERPQDLGDRTLLSAEEAAEQNAQAETRGGLWAERGARVSDDLRTSLIVDPSNGRLPPLQSGVEEQLPGEDQEPTLPVRIRVGGIGTDGPESRGLSERCLIGFNAGPPIVPGFYNQNLEIVQTDDFVVLHTEMIHEARIIALDGRGRLPVQIRPWMGASLGHWDGDTLVIETTNFRSELPGFTPSPFTATGTAEHMRVTERLRLHDADTLHYEFMIDDPATYTRPFTAIILMKRSDSPIYEYACHEGNYPLKHILAGARSNEASGHEADGD